MIVEKDQKNIRIAVVGNYLPRLCGIATFTTDLCNALALELNEEAVLAVAINDMPEGYDYPPRVKFNIRVNEQQDYFLAADFLNSQQTDAVIIQHEFGIFGGSEGSYILHLIKALQKPVITNLHTVLENPNYNQKVIIQEIARYSARILVMSQKAKELLQNIYQISPSKINFIPHGVPDLPFRKPGVYNKQFNAKGKDILLTFGLLSPDKGIETLIQAMPRIVDKHPNLLYIVLGQTHPHILEAWGDAYRHRLQQLVIRMGLRQHVRFHGYFVDDSTLLKYLQTAKIYVVPYLKKEQITSGTLSMAIGVGAAVVSTPFWYAEELLADGRGKLVPFKEPDAMASTINELLDDEVELERIRKNAYSFGRSMTWKEVSRQHIALILEIIQKRKKIPVKAIVSARQSYTRLKELPEINLFHLQTLTDDTGILQHAIYNIPDRNHGYCSDDNARALIFTSHYYHLRQDKKILPLLNIYLSFLHYAFNSKNQRFRNFMSYDRRWLEDAGSEDSHGRSLWALGNIVQWIQDDGIREIALALFLNGLPTVEIFSSPRAWAFSIIGLCYYLEKYPENNTAITLLKKLSQLLFKLFESKISSDWLWCEDKITYANAKLPQALILAGSLLQNYSMQKLGFKVLGWLLEIQTSKEGHLSVIGNSEWHSRTGKKSIFDQQPVEVMNLIDACKHAYFLTYDKKWREEAERCFSWFLGNNDSKILVYNFETGGCHDGLGPEGVNANQGAESTLSWLISLVMMYEIVGMDTLVEKRRSQIN